VFRARKLHFIGRRSRQKWVIKNVFGGEKLQQTYFVPHFGGETCCNYAAEIGLRKKISLHCRSLDGEMVFSATPFPPFLASISRDLSCPVLWPRPELEAI